MSKLGSARIIERTALLMLASAVFAFSVRLAIAPLDLLVIYVVFLCLACLASAYLTMRVLKLHNIGAYLLVAIATIFLSVIATITGGLNSPIIILFPVVPIAASLLFKGPINWLLSGFFIALTIAYTFFDSTRFSAINMTLTDEENTLVRAGWIIVGTFVVTTFAAFFSVENRKLTEELHKKAHMDYLTHLPNRRGVEEHLEAEIESAKNMGHWMSVIMIDIDHFKKYNDINGHARGDECIRLVAEKLNNHLSEPEEFVGRYGGEEFIVTLRSPDPDTALEKAEALRKEIEDMNIMYGPDCQNPVTITLGCYTLEARKVGVIDKLIYEADHALYLGKAGGRNQVTTKDD